MTWNILADLANGTTVTETHMDEIRQNIEHLGAMLTGADEALSSKASGSLIGAAMAIGTYTGDATNPHAITGVGFQPRVVIFLGDSGTDGPVVAFELSSTLYVFELDTNTPEVGAGVVSFDSDGFTLDTSIFTNENTITFYYIAWE